MQFKIFLLFQRKDWKIETSLLTNDLKSVVSEYMSNFKIFLISTYLKEKKRTHRIELKVFISIDIFNFIE